MKKAQVLLGIALVMLALLTGCSQEEFIAYDDMLLELATKEVQVFDYPKAEKNPFLVSSRYFNVSKNSNHNFTVDINGSKMEVIVDTTGKTSDYETTEITDVSPDYHATISESKAIIFDYIENSSVLKDKEGIKAYIDTLSVKEAKFTDDANTVAYFSYSDDTLYINKDNAIFTCEWVIVHEFVHAISYYTHGCAIENEKYAFNLFNEVMTDLITCSMQPEQNISIRSGYMNYYNLLLPYIDLVGLKAIDAYFYGYQEIYDMLNYDEFELFVLIVIEFFGRDDVNSYNNSLILYNNLIFKWYSNISL